MLFPEHARVNSIIYLNYGRPRGCRSIPPNKASSLLGAIRESTYISSEDLQRDRMTDSHGRSLCANHYIFGGPIVSALHVNVIRESNKNVRVAVRA